MVDQINGGEVDKNCMGTEIVVIGLMVWYGSGDTGRGVI